MRSQSIAAQFIAHFTFSGGSIATAFNSSASGDLVQSVVKKRCLFEHNWERRIREEFSGFPPINDKMVRKMMKITQLTNNKSFNFFFQKYI